MVYHYTYRTWIWYLNQHNYDETDQNHHELWQLKKVHTMPNQWMKWAQQIHEPRSPLKWLNSASSSPPTPKNSSILLFSACIYRRVCVCVPLKTVQFFSFLHVFIDVREREREREREGEGGRGKVSSSFIHVFTFHRSQYSGNKPQQKNTWNSSSSWIR